MAATLTAPQYAYPALKGVRVVVRDGIVHLGSRVLRRVRNPYIQLLLGHPCYENFIAIISHDDSKKSSLKFCRNDKMKPNGKPFSVNFIDVIDPALPFNQRVEKIWSAMLSREAKGSYVKCPIVELKNTKEVKLFRDNHAEEGVVFVKANQRIREPKEVAAASERKEEQQKDKAVREAVRAERKRMKEIHGDVDAMIEKAVLAERARCSAIIQRLIEDLEAGVVNTPKGVAKKLRKTV